MPQKGYLQIPLDTHEVGFPGDRSNVSLPGTRIHTSAAAHLCSSCSAYNMSILKNLLLSEAHLILELLIEPSQEDTAYDDKLLCVLGICYAIQKDAFYKPAFLLSAFTITIPKFSSCMTQSPLSSFID